MSLVGKKVWFGTYRGRIVAQASNGSVFLVRDNQFKTPLLVNPDELHLLRIAEELGQLPGGAEAGESPKVEGLLWG